MATEPQRLCVFCGSNSGADPRYRQVASALGADLATSGYELVYGGGHVGLMGVVADAALAAGGPVTGVMTEQLVGLEVAHEGLTTLDIQPSMHARKLRMAQLADGVIVLPGGYGTLDETFEILTWNQLGIESTPVVFLDVEGFFDPLFELIDKMVSEGFVKDAHGRLAQRTSEPGEAVRLAAQAPTGYIAKWIDDDAQS
jgi:uncharacterized protein (TIGR00730 family)